MANSLDKRYLQRAESGICNRIKAVKREAKHKFSMVKVIKSVQKLFKAYKRINKIGIFSNYSGELYKVFESYEEKRNN